MPLVSKALAGCVRMSVQYPSARFFPGSNSIHTLFCLTSCVNCGCFIRERPCAILLEPSKTASPRSSFALDTLHPPCMKRSNYDDFYADKIRSRKVSVFGDRSSSPTKSNPITNLSLSLWINVCCSLVECMNLNDLFLSVYYVYCVLRTVFNIMCVVMLISSHLLCEHYLLLLLTFIFCGARLCLC